MYHDQVLTPIKAIYDFNAINITLGLPFLRITPDLAQTLLYLVKMYQIKKFSKSTGVCTKNKVNIKPKKKLGQNFLIDENIIKKLLMLYQFQKKMKF